MKKLLLFVTLLSALSSQVLFGQCPFRQGSSYTVKVGPFEDTAGAVVSSLTIQKAHVRLSKNWGAYGAAHADQGASDAGAAYTENGDYNISLDATDTNTTGPFRISIVKAGALPVWRDCYVYDASTFDRDFAGDVLSVADIWSRLTGSEGAGSYGKLIVDNLNQSVGSIGTDTTSILTVLGTPAGADIATDIASVNTAVAGVQSDTDNIQTRIPAALVSGRIDSSVGAYQTGLTPLQPTTAGRTLDVTATGAAGVDWGNVENQATVVGLTGTTIKDATDVATVDDIWAAPTSGLVTAGSIGKLEVDTAAAIGAPVTTVSGDIAAVQSDVTAVKTTTDQFVFTAANKVDASVRDWRGSTPNVLASGRVDSSVGAYQTGLAPLQPTVSGRSLDVSAGGEAGIDWANIGTPGATVNLSATTVSAVSGAVGSVTGSVGGNVTGSVGSISGISFPSNFSLLSIDGSGHVVLTSGANTSIAQAIRDLTIEGSLTNGQLTRLIAATLIGKSSGSGTGTIVFRDANDTANRVTATVSGGNRTAVTLNP